MAVMQTLAQVVEDTGEEQQVGLKAVVELFQVLNRRQVRYCHWKSNLRLERSLSGQTDLDLLVDPQHILVFEQILAEHRIKNVLAPPGKRYPSLKDYIGFDPSTGRCFHLHIHYQLVLGEQFVKNYHLPLESLFLDLVRLHHGVKIPVPELELIVLSIRALLKYRDRDAVKDILLIRSSGIPAHILDEIHWLFKQSSADELSRRLREISQYIPANIIQEFLISVSDSPRDGRKLLHLRREVRKALGLYQRYNRAIASLIYVRELWKRRNSFLKFKPDRKMTLPHRGLVVALVGVDGAGKTTLCQELASWLAWKMDAHLYYLGSKQLSRLSEGLYFLFRMYRRSYRTFSGRFGEKNIISKWLAALRQTMLYSHNLSIGYDRYRRYLAGKRNAGKGSIAIFDRFPLAAPLDGPQIHLAAAGDQSIRAASFSKWEQRLYAKFQPPDLLVVLSVSPEISIQRKPDHQLETIEAKNQILSELTAGVQTQTYPTEWICIDAEQPFDEVLRQVKIEIWKKIVSGN